MEVVNRPPRPDEVWLLSLDPTRGAEIQKTRPCLVISPDEMNRYLQTIVVAPMTTVIRPYPTRVPVRFQGKSGQVALDQLRAIDRQRLLRKLGTVSASTAQGVSATLLEMFSRS
jgi:mRNA interferase MazF